MTDLPNYDEAQVRSLEVLQMHSELIGEAYINHSKAIHQVLETYKQYLADPNLKSRQYSYQAALINLESTKAMIQEFKDNFLKSGLVDWLP